MDEFAFARMLHVLGVVLWIGGVAMVTTVLIPVAAKINSAGEQSGFFGHLERRFATQARFTTLLVGLSGIYMVHFLDAWSRFTELRYWWMHAMVLVWFVFSLMLFVVEPSRRKKVTEMVQRDPKKTIVVAQRMHWILLSLSLITIAGAVAGSHGWMAHGG